MIKIKIHNQFYDRNELTFRGLHFARRVLRDFSIELTDSNDFDFLFVGMMDFYDMNLSIEDSVEWGLDELPTEGDVGKSGV